MQPIPVFLPGKSHGQRSLPGYGPQCGRGSDMTEYTQRLVLQEILKVVKREENERDQSLRST